MQLSTQGDNSPSVVQEYNALRLDKECLHANTEQGWRVQIGDISAHLKFSYLALHGDFLG